jgi:hypothetical protein
MIKATDGSILFNRLPGKFHLALVGAVVAQEEVTLGRVLYLPGQIVDTERTTHRGRPPRKDILLQDRLGATAGVVDMSLPQDHQRQVPPALIMQIG